MMENIKPMDIEKRSFAIITELLGDTKLEEENELVIKRVIHTTADFDYVQNLVFSPHAVTKGLDALRAGCHIVTAQLPGKCIFAIGNAPTALIALHGLIEEGKLDPALIIGVPVGFVNVVESKELFLDSPVPHIIARGRKGGSNVAAAICNALLYQILR